MHDPLPKTSTTRSRPFRDHSCARRIFTMFDRDLGTGAFAGSVFRRHGRMILMSVAAVVIVGGLVQGAFVPKPLDFGVVTALIVRRFGLMRTIVTALVLLMTAIAVMPIPHGGREKAYFAAMKSDLKNLASQEEIYYSDHDAYTSSAMDLAFTNSEGVEVTVHATPKGVGCMGDARSTRAVRRVRPLLR